MCHAFEFLNFLASDLVQLEIVRGYTTIQSKDIFIHGIIQKNVSFMNTIKNGISR
jgi:hypothetical protein